MPTPTTTGPAQKPAPAVRPLDFDQRLVLAALAVDARLDTEPLDLADVIHRPVDLPAPPRPAYPTPVAALLQRAARRLETSGWCRGQTVDGAGARCLYGALRSEDPDSAHIDDALAVLLEAIRRELSPDTDTVPAANDHLLRDGRAAVRILGAAAALADARGL